MNYSSKFEPTSTYLEECLFLPNCASSWVRHYLQVLLILMVDVPPSMAAEDRTRMVLLQMEYRKQELEHLLQSVPLSDALRTAAQIELKQIKVSM